MSWPMPDDYARSIQSPESAFSDPELQRSTPVCDKYLRIPKAICGNFAAVFQLKTSHDKFAVKCFLKDSPARDQRYALLSSTLNRLNLPFMIDFQYIIKGMVVNGKWYPILKMPWLECETLVTFVEKNLAHPAVLKEVACDIHRHIAELRSHCIALGDLQHGNIVICRGKVMFIDFDGMFVPGMEQLGAADIGLPSYQHPKRTAVDFGPTLDTFPEWVIVLSLLALADNPSLWQKLHKDPDHLLLEARDFHNPTRSAAFRALSKMSDAKLRQQFEQLARHCQSTTVATMPILELDHDITKLHSNVGLPDWIVNSPQWMARRQSSGKLARNEKKVTEEKNTRGWIHVNQTAGSAARSFPGRSLCHKKRKTSALNQTLASRWPATTISTNINQSLADLRQWWRQVRREWETVRRILRS